MLHAQTATYKVLLIGNSDYANFPKLNGAPSRDVDAMYQVLVSLGFEETNIIVAKDLKYWEFLRTLLDFRAGLQTTDAVLFYFSGHGFSIDGDDYLAPVDFSFGETKDSTRRKSIGVAQVVTYLAENPSRVIVLDACRTDAPLLKKMVDGHPTVDLDPLISTRSAGSLIAYSTSAGKASDASSQSGLSFYTQYLVNSLAARPKDMYTALSNAKAATSDASASRQVPAVYDEMVGSFEFLNGTTPTEKKAPKPAYRRLGYQEARILIPAILDLPRPCAFRVIAPTENINLRGDLVTLAQTSTQHVPACVLIEPPQDRDPAAFEDHPDYPNGSVVISAKRSWSTQEDNLVTQFRRMGFGQVVHGKALPETEQEDFEVVFGTGTLW